MEQREAVVPSGQEMEQQILVKGTDSGLSGSLSG